MPNITDVVTILNTNSERMIDNLSIFLAAIVSLFILVMVVSYFAYFPVRDFVRARKKHIKMNIDSSEKANKDAQLILAKANEKLASSKKEGRDILKEYEERAKIKHKEMLNNAKQEANLIIENAHSKIKKDEEEMKEKLSQEVSSIAMQAAEKLIKEKLSSNANKKMIDEFIKELNK